MQCGKCCKVGTQTPLRDFVRQSTSLSGEILTFAFDCAQMEEARKVETNCSKCAATHGAEAATIVQFRQDPMSRQQRKQSVMHESNGPVFRKPRPCCLEAVGAAFLPPLRDAATGFHEIRRFSTTSKFFRAVP